MFSTYLPHIGILPSGKRNSITDVEGVSIGHSTLAHDEIQTGVTVIMPHQGDLFLHKVPAAVSVINGFGKSVGLTQLKELGSIETPIALTNTFSVSAIAQAQIQQAITKHPKIGREWSTINPLVLECNDGYLNDIQAMKINTTHYCQALDNLSQQVKQGAIGAGRGMSCFELKGGIGTASRQVILKNGDYVYHVGALVLSNFGRLPQLIIDGQHVGRTLSSNDCSCTSSEKGSIIMVIATDAPLDTRQLQRLANRASAGLARTGSIYGHGSGDIALAFTNHHTLPHEMSEPMPSVTFLHDGLLDLFFSSCNRLC